MYKVIQGVCRAAIASAIVIIHCSAAFSSTGDIQVGTLPSNNDCSNRCSLTDKITLASWETKGDAEGFVPDDKDAYTKSRESVAGWVVYEGNKCLSVKFPAGKPSNIWRTVTRTYPTPLDLAERPMIEYGLMSYEGPGRDFVTRLALIGPDGERYESHSHIIPTLWRGIIFDVSGCKFLDRIHAIEIGIINEGTEPWDTPTILLDGLSAGRPMDLDFNITGSEERLLLNGKGKIARKDGAIHFDFKKNSSIEIRIDSSRNNIYNPALEKRNTIRIALDNRSKARQLRLGFITDSDPTFDDTKSKIVEIAAKPRMQAVDINLSDIPAAKGMVKGLRIEPIGASGTIIIDRISFEKERPILPNAGKVTSCKADKERVTVEGIIDSSSFPTQGATIEIRHAPLWKEELPYDSLELLASVEATPQFSIGSIPNSRLDGKMTHLSSRMKAVMRMPDGAVVAIGKPFFIENWEDFCENPYAFTLPTAAWDVTDFGAKGDGCTNDNYAIQRAIDAASGAGGGQVVLSGSGDTESPREYLATNLELKSGVNIVIEPTAVLRQSPIYTHYTESYRPEYGHDNVIPNIPWTHCMYTNMPLILAKDVSKVKITGGGTIRMDDTWSENPSWLHYARHCSDRIHIVPLAFCNTRHIEVSDIDIIRSNNYHTIFYRADSVSINNLKMVEVACLSGDGLSFGNAVTNVSVNRCIFESNDDGIVLCSSYKDPRGGGWRIRVDSIDSSVRNINVSHSYIDSKRGGGGKAIALIPWGSTNPRQDYNEIDHITVSDCVLRGGASVGAWPDNPFDGKPFDNSEIDDYAPVKNLDIRHNEYLSPCELFCVKPTTVITDAPFHGSSDIKNGDFSDRLAYWSHTGKVEASTPGQVNITDGQIYEGIYLEPGLYTVTVDADGNCKPFVRKPLESATIFLDSGQEFEVTAPSTWIIGVEGTNATVRSIVLNK